MSLKLSSKTFIENILKLYIVFPDGVVIFKNFSVNNISTSFSLERVLSKIMYIKDLITSKTTLCS